MIQVRSESRASDGSFLALADAAKAARNLDCWLIVGGHMVNLHVLRAGLNLPMRATRDADIAVELAAIKTTPLVADLRSLGYDNASSGNRSDRQADGSTRTIDLLVPSYSPKHAPNLDAGEILVDGFPVLHAALSRPAVQLVAAVELSTGDQFEVSLPLPDVVCSIAMKAFAYCERFAARDAEDAWRLLEVAHADGLDAAGWPRTTTFAAAARRLTTMFDSPGQALAAAASTRLGQTRVRALTRSLIGRVGQAYRAR